VKNRPDTRPNLAGETQPNEADIPLPGGTIGKKLAVSFAPLAIVVAVLALHLQTTIVTIGKSEDLAINGLSRKVQLAGALDQLAERMRSDSRGLLLAPYAHNPKFAELMRVSYRGALADFKRALAEAMPLVDGPREQKVLAGLQKDIADWQLEFEGFERLCSEGDAEGPGESKSINWPRWRSMKTPADSRQKVRRAQSEDSNCRSDGARDAGKAAKNAWRLACTTTLPSRSRQRVYGRSSKSGSRMNLSRRRQCLPNRDQPRQLTIPTCSAG
jgi:hypothetical protein